MAKSLETIFFKCTRVGLQGDLGLPAQAEQLARLFQNPADLAAGIYLKRSAGYMVNGVPADWTGVEALTEK